MDNWIWLDEDKFPEYQNSRFTVFCSEENKKYCVATFQKTFFINKKVKRLLAKVSADTKYVLLINGKIILRGPAIVGGDYGNKEPLDYWFYDEIDLTSELIMGENIISADVQLQPDVQADYSMGHGGLLFNAEIEYDDGSVELIKSDETWLSCVNPAYVKPGVFNDNNKIKKMFPSACVKNIWNLIPKNISNLHEEVTSFNKIFTTHYEDRISIKDGRIIISPGCPATFTLDFGKIYSAYLLIEAKCEKDTKLTINTQEIIGRTDRTETVICSESTKYEGIRLHSIRYLNITVTATERPVELDIKIIFSCYPVINTGDFECDNQLLNKIYELGRWTTQICRQSYHLDSPIHQEALGCTGDYYIESLINYYAFGDAKLTRLDIVRTGKLLEIKKGFMFHTSYSLIWTEMIKDYYLYTGDKSIFDEIKKPLCILLDRFLGYIGESGIIDNPPNYMFMDWVPVGEFNLHHPPKVMGQGYLSAFLYRALLNGAYILGDCDKSSHYKQEAESIKKSFNSHLWDSEKGLYRDGKNGNIKYETSMFLPYTEGTYYSQHTNALAVLYGLAEDNLKKPIMEKVMEDKSLIKAQPYFMHFVFEALNESGMFEKYAINQMERWGALLDECDGGLKEVWSGFDCDYSHAWGATPTYQMPSKVLGVVPTSPGFKTISFNPKLCGLKYAKGKIPTPYGYIEVICKDGEKKITVPKEITISK